MRKFASYGPPDKTIHYYAPRTALIEQICTELLGDNPSQDGHYITIWAPRQTGKTWLLQEALIRLRQSQPAFHIAKLNLQDLADQAAEGVYAGLAYKLSVELQQPLAAPTNQHEFAEIFTQSNLAKPLLLILDEFDALAETAIHGVVGVLRNIYLHRHQQSDRPTHEKYYQLHGVALVGVRSVLGIDHASGSPFNVQRSVPIPNLTLAEVEGLFHWYTQESGRPVESAVVEQIYTEMQGQPGLTCWLGELLTETYAPPAPQAVTAATFAEAYAAALKVLPNNNILNIISKAKVLPYKNTVLELFQTDKKLEFRYDDAIQNYLFTNGVIDREQVNLTDYYVKFASPFVQKRLFYFFARELFGRLSVLYEPFSDLSDTITENGLALGKLIRRYEAYVQQNGAWLWREAPRRKTDERIYEAVYHFNLYMYLTQFLADYDGRVIPEFPTGNGKIDLFIHYAGTTYGLEVKSFVNQRAYQQALLQVARYGQQLGLAAMWLLFFVETVDDHNRRKFEATYVDPATGVTVHPLLVATGVR